MVSTQPKEFHSLIVCHVQEDTALDVSSHVIEAYANILQRKRYTHDNIVNDDFFHHFIISRRGMLFTNGEFSFRDFTDDERIFYFKTLFMFFFSLYLHLSFHKDSTRLEALWKSKNPMEFLFLRLTKSNFFSRHPLKQKSIIQMLR